MNGEKEYDPYDIEDIRTEQVQNRNVEKVKVHNLDELSSPDTIEVRLTQQLI